MSCSAASLSHSPQALMATAQWLLLPADPEPTTPPPEEGPQPHFVVSTEDARAQPHSSASPQLSKRRAAFHKAFEEIAEHEALLACFSCAWQREVPYHGRLYVSSGHLCFHASLLLKEIKVGTWGGLASVCALKKTNTALLVPNALSIRTEQGEKVSLGRGPPPILQQSLFSCRT
uniref:GRAM domain-containing protein n=1 Tax=Phasianus colchicus TaxID=9054 RepID=A0A669QLG9_PHACC